MKFPLVQRSTFEHICDAKTRADAKAKDAISETARWRAKVAKARAEILGLIRGVEDRRMSPVETLRKLTQILRDL